VRILSNLAFFENAENDQVFGELKRRGVKVDFEVTQLNDLGMRAFGIRDVDGNLIQFFGK